MSERAFRIATYVICFVLMASVAIYFNFVPIWLTWTAAFASGLCLWGLWIELRDLIDEDLEPEEQEDDAPNPK